MALFNKNKPFIGVRIYDYFLEVWERFDSTPSNNDLSAVITAASNAQTTANTAQSVANAAMPKTGGIFSGTVNFGSNFIQQIYPISRTALTGTYGGIYKTSDNQLVIWRNNTSGVEQKLNLPLTATGTYLTDLNAVANTCLSALNGFDAWYQGDYNFAGTPNGLVVPAFANVEAVNITYDSANGFTFPYAGKYIIFVEMSGDCLNNRTDWYQEVTTAIQNGAIIATQQLTTNTRIPPSGTFSIRSNGSAVIKVLAGDKWKPTISFTANGSTTNGLYRIKIKKVA